MAARVSKRARNEDRQTSARHRKHFLTCKVIQKWNEWSWEMVSGQVCKHRTGAHWVELDEMMAQDFSAAEIRLEPGMCHCHLLIFKVHYIYDLISS